jgi:hypothetical protein
VSNKALADGFARIMTEVGSWDECKDLMNGPSREMCEGTVKDLIIFKHLQFPVNHMARVTRCQGCKHIHVEVGLFQEPVNEIQDQEDPSTAG